MTIAKLRELLGVAVLAGAGLFGLLSRHRGAKAAAPAVFPVMHTDAEWRSLLGPAAYDVLRRQGRDVLLRRMRSAALLVGDEIRPPYRLADLLNDGLVPIDRSFNQAATIVASTALPTYASMPFNRCNMPIALRRRNLVRSCCGPRRNDDLSAGIKPAAMQAGSWIHGMARAPKPATPGVRWVNSRQFVSIKTQPKLAVPPSCPRLK